MRARQIVCALSVFGLLGGCSQVTALSRGGYGIKPIEAKSAADVGTVHIDVVGLSRWDDVKDSFAPGYSLTGDGAVTAVRAAQNLESTSVQNAFSASGNFGLAGPVSNITSKDTSTSATDAGGKVTSTTSSETDKTTDKSGASPPASSTQAGLQAASPASWNAAQPTLAPSMAYSAANSLFQYVTALKNGVDGLTDQCGYDAYLVMLRVAVIPTKRRQPYDIFVDLSIIPGAIGVDVSRGRTANGPALLPITRGPVSEPGNFISSRKAAGCAANSPNTVVVHTLSADSLENTQEDWTSQAMRSAALGIAAKWGPAALGANFAKISAALDQYLSMRPNSLLTIGSSSPNSVRIRLGASRTGNDDYETLPMTHDIELLVLAPADAVYRDYTALGRITFTDVRTGHVFEHDVSNENIVARQTYVGAVATTLADEIHSTPDTTYPSQETLFRTCSNDYSKCGEINRLINDIANGQYDKFELDADNAKISPDYYPELWQYLSEAAITPGLARARFQLPSSHLRCPVSQMPVLNDDGDTTTISFVGGVGFRNRLINAILESDDVKHPLRLAAASNGATDALSVFSFPSLKKIGWTGDKSKLLVDLVDARSPDRNLCAGSGSSVYEVLAVPDPAPKKSGKAKSTATNFSVQAAASQIAEDGGQGSVSVGVKFTAKVDQVKVTSKPAELLSVGGTAPGTDQAVVLTADGQVVVKLQNLISGKTEHLIFSPSKDGKPAGQAVDIPFTVH